ncbi:MAG: hypothetical protein C7B43_20460 [Sulfobacillus benefaciens]|uniref:Uncharacterized protein n=1 Tax=Sulfobacillus benefaciens TaxID=453960 RepID=A0A2T2WL74_9FIRM|nr:MAG: hypothetical protein C7B43_20460 [Sulfobacillus benefaciens]
MLYYGRVRGIFVVSFHMRRGDSEVSGNDVATAKTQGIKCQGKCEPRTACLLQPALVSGQVFSM